MERKEEILQAAEKMFLKYGFRKCTMHDIAKECGIQKSALYYYFENRDQIFLTMIENRFAKMEEEVGSAIESADSTKAKLKAFMKKKWQILHEYKPFMDLFEKKYIRFEDVIDEKDKMLAFDIKCLEDILEKALENEEIYVESLDPLVSMLLGFTYGSIYAIMEMGAKWDYDKKINEALKIIYTGVGKKEGV